MNSNAAAFAAADWQRELLERLTAPLFAATGNAQTDEWLKAGIAGLARNAERWRGAYESYYREQFGLWRQFIIDGTGSRPAVDALASDRRFSMPEWREPYFAWLAQSYVLASQCLCDLVQQTDAEPQARRKNAFLVRQFVDAMCPANFFWTNPAALKQAMATGGASVARGMQNLAADMKKGIVSTTDERAFSLGRNLAVTPGAVVYENDYFQLIQYEPTTPKVFELPLLIVPPCINKYYILDLQPANSFVRYAVAQGMKVFMMSWRNVPASMGHARWDDYLEHGVLRAAGIVREIAGTEDINALGFCIGGTLLASALAVAGARGENSVASLTLLATLLDYSDTGDLSIYIDESVVAQRERQFAAGGLLQGRELALAFASLRPNDLIWRYVVDNYLLGGTPEAFDLLHWNADSTNLPGPMYAYYLRNLYLENRLRVPGALTMCGTPVRLSCLAMPAYIVATREDHIVPWKSAYATVGLLGGKSEFVLGGSGHIAGIINPPAAARRNFWTAPDAGGDPEEWLARAASKKGSWWPHWLHWLSAHAGRSVTADRTLGSRRHPVIEPAPGRYVMQPADEEFARN